MKPNEAELILLLAFEHEPETRAEYFIIEAQKSGYSLIVFFDSMLKAYKRLETFVNSRDYRAYGGNETGGEKEYLKKTISLNRFTGGRLTGFLDCSDIIELRRPLHDFGTLALASVKPCEAESKPTAPPQTETTASKIARILEPLRGAFDKPEHIDTIIQGFVSYLIDNKLPQRTNKAVIRRMLVSEFIKPFRTLQDNHIMKQKDISTLLLFFIEKGTMNETEYSEAYLKRLLSDSKPIE